MDVKESDWNDIFPLQKITEIEPNEMSALRLALKKGISENYAQRLLHKKYKKGIVTRRKVMEDGVFVYAYKIAPK